MPVRLLFVDDEPSILRGIRMNLFHMEETWDLHFAENGAQGLEKLQEGPFDVVVADMRMPGMDGIKFLARVRQENPQTVRVMLTGNADLGTAVEAVNAGNVFRFLTKPCKPALLIEALEACIEQYRLVTAERELLTNTLGGSIRLLTELLSISDPKGFSYALWLRDSVRSAADLLALENAWEVVLGATLSQIGVVTLPDDLVTRWRDHKQLGPQEARLVARVPEIGQRLLSKIPRLESVGRIVLYQNKNFDGSGFPEDAVAEQDIPLGSRLIKIFADLARISSREGARFKIQRYMKERSGLYDPELFEKVFHLFVPPDAGPTASVPISVSQLRLGHKLCANIERTDGLVILATGSRISPTMLERIHNFAALGRLKEPIYIEKTPQAGD